MFSNFTVVIVFPIKVLYNYCSGSPGTAKNAITVGAAQSTSKSWDTLFEEGGGGGASGYDIISKQIIEILNSQHEALKFERKLHF